MYTAIAIIAIYVLFSYSFVISVQRVLIKTEKQSLKWFVVWFAPIFFPAMLGDILITFQFINTRKLHNMRKEEAKRQKSEFEKLAQELNKMFSPFGFNPNDIYKGPFDRKPYERKTPW